MLKDLVEYLVKNIAEHPEKIAIEEIQDRESITVEIRCPEEEKGRLIGRGGKTIKAIRLLAKVWAGLKQQKADVRIL
ncbi:MAG TPA: KH domain-containing protein [bacterium]|nr:KH domain-containing protein [bacterium]